MRGFRPWWAATSPPPARSTRWWPPGEPISACWNGRTSGWECDAIARSSWQEGSCIYSANHQPQGIAHLAGGERVRSRWLVSVLLVCAMILAAACGSAGSGTTGGSGASTGNGQAGGGGEETGPTGEPFKVGVLLPYSGVYAALGESMTNAMELYFESIGWQAGGRPIELIKEDTEANPEVGLRRVRKLVEQDEVDILTGVVSSGVLMSIRDYVDEAGVFLISSNAGAVPIATDRKSPYIWLVSYTNAQPPSALGAWWYENVAQEVFLTAPAYQAGYDSTGAFRETFEAAGGRVVGELFPPLGTTDYAPYLTQIREANPASIYAFFAGSDARNFILAYEQYGLKGQIPLAAAGFMFDETTLAAVGEAAVGHYHSM